MSHPSLRRSLRIAALIGAGLLATPGAADAGGRMYQVRDDDVARFAILGFNRHAERNEWRAAILELQKLFDVPAQRNSVLAVEGAKPLRFENAWRAGVRIFDALPAAGRAMWEDLERRPAEELLARGLRLRREEDLASAAHRYPARDVRRRAHDALAHLAVARGDFDRAARELESLLECVEPADHPQVWARLAFARAQAGDADALARAALLAAASLDVQVDTPGGRQRLGDFFAEMKSVVDAAGRRASGARLFGGDRHGSGLSDPPPQADQPAWIVSTGLRPGEENDDYTGTDAFTRPVVPAIAQGAVLVNNGLSLSAYEVSTGRPTWTVTTAQTEPIWRDNPSAYHAVAVADGVCYAALATRADAPAVERRFVGHLIIYSLPHRVLHAVDARTGDVLWSHDAAHLQGRPDAEEIEHESVASAPLVVGDDVLVVTWRFEMRYEVRLVCFDRRTGATRWRTSLVHGQQEMNLFGRPVKELIVQPIAELDGQLYVATGMGVAAAVDRATGAISWLSEYSTTDVPQTYQWFETRDRRVQWRPSPIAATRTAVVMAPLESAELFGFDPRTGATLWKQRRESDGAQALWFLGATGGRAYAVGSRLFAYDLATGRNAWPTPEGGRLAKPGVDPKAAVGSGLLTGDMVYVPTPRGIVQMDARSGACVDTRALPDLVQGNRRQPRALGNLVAADGALVVAQANTLDAYYRFEDLAARLQSRLASAPEDPQLRLEAGDVFRNAGRHDEAIECFERGLAAASALGGRAPGRIETGLRRSLVESLLARAAVRRSIPDGPGAFADLSRAADVARERGDAVRALFALADCAAQTGRDEVCDAALHRIATEFSDVQTQIGTDDRTDAGALASLALGRRAADRGDVAGAVGEWLRLLDERPDAAVGGTSAASAVRSALDLLRKTRADDVSRLVEAHARKGLDAARASGDVFALHRIARTSPSPAVAADAALTAASIHLGVNRPREAAAVLEGLVRSPGPKATLALALWDLSLAYRAMEETPRERAALRRLSIECGDEKLADGRTAGDAARAELTAPRFRDAPAPLPDPRPPLAQQWEILEGTRQSGMLLLDVQGTRPRGLEGRLVFQQVDRLRCFDGRSGDEIWNADAGLDLRRTYGTTGGMVLVGEDQRTSLKVVRVDHVRVEDGKRKWTQRLGGTLGARYAESASSLGLVYVLRFENNVRGERVSWLTALSADTGTVVAERQLAGQIQAKVACAADAVVVFEMITQGATPRRRVMTFDGATLSPRGVVEVEGVGSPFALNPAGSSIVVTTQRHDGVAAIDVRTGQLAWPGIQLPGRALKNLLVVPGGVIVSDDGDQIRRIDAETGKETWLRALDTASGKPSARALGYNGEAADGDLVVATLVASQGGNQAWSVALDAATGEVRWEVELPLEGRALPRPAILQGVVAYELNSRRPDGFDCKVVLLDRRDGTTAETLVHPSMSRGQGSVSAYFQGPFVVLWAPPRADIAVYAGSASAK